MKISVNGLGKRFDREWVFKNFSFDFLPGQTYALVGPNGSGKSTLLQILWGQMLPSTGSLSYSIGEKSISIHDVYKEVGVATPYMDLIDEFTLTEMVAFHFKHKICRHQNSTQEIIDAMELKHASNKMIRDFSSGMRQRLKLALAFFSKTSALFLDEPTTNLDENGKAWYWQNLKQLPANQLIIIASNQADEYPPSAQKVDILQYKSGYKTAKL